MSILCCKQADHPDDWICIGLENVFGSKLDQCDDQSSRPDDPPSSPGGPVPENEPTFKELPTWGIERLRQFDKMFDEPTPDQLATFVDGLRADGFYHDALQMSNHLVLRTPPLDTRVHSRLALIQGQVFEVVNEPDAAKKSFEMATHWILKSDDIQTFSRDYAPTAKTIKKLADQKPEALILVAQNLYAKGAYKKALRVTQHIEGNVPLGSRYVHIQNNLIRVQALEKLKDTEGAAASMDAVTDLTNMIRDQSQMDAALQRATQIR